MSNCKFCLYWKNNPEATLDDEDCVRTGQCRINPPVMVGTSEYGHTAWPVTKETDYCGKWESGA